MYAKKHLCNKFMPLSIIEALKGKHKNLAFQESMLESKDMKQNKNIYTVTWELKGYSKKGTASDFNK